jgi:hypothetical protein
MGNLQTPIICIGPIEVYDIFLCTATQQHEDAEYEVFDLDPQQVLNKLQSYEQQLGELKEHVSGLSGKHDELDQAWKKHGVSQA